MINELFPDYNNKPSKHKNFIYSRKNDYNSNAKPAVSIITPLFNTNEIFNETINCILAQSFQNFEWIIVNDGSSNPVTLDILSKLSKIDKKIRVINHETNKGLPASRNTGINSAKGDYLFFIDSDDLLELTAIEKFYNFLRVNKEYDFVNSYVVGFGHLNYLWTGNFAQTDKFFNENPITATFMARKEVFALVQFDENMKGGFEDWDFWLRAAIEGKWGFTIPEYLFWYRRSDPGLNKWGNWDNGEKTERFKQSLKAKYLPALESKGFPFKQHNKYNKEVIGKDDVLRADNILEKTKKRMLFVLPWFNLGGADKFNLDVLEGLVGKFDWEATIISTLSSQNEWLPKFAKVTPDIFNLPNYFSSTDYYAYFDYLINTRKPDVIFITHSQFGYWICPYLKQRYPHIPIVDYLHVEDPGWEDGWGYLRMSSLLSGAIDKTFVSSHMLRFWLNKAHQRNLEEIEVCYTNIDVEQWKHNPDNRKKIRKEWDLNDDLPIILFAGRIDQQKQPLVIINSIKYLLKRTDYFRFILIGDGPDFYKMKQEISNCGIENSDRIWCLGGMKNEEVKKYLDAADIFFLPSEYEGISLAIYESMAKGLAIVASDVGGQRELVTTDCGILLKRSNPENESKQYGDLLADLILNSERLNVMKKASRERIVKHFEISKMTSQMDDSLTSLVTKPYYPVPFQYQSLLNHYLVSETHCHELYGALNRTNANQNSNVNFTNTNQNNASYLNSDIKNKLVEVTAWYEKEYEALPLWYKRFGHLLKVVYGRRSLKSLLKK